MAFNYTPLKNSGLFEPKSVTLVLLGIGVIVALILCYAWLRPPILAPVEEGRRLADSIGWAIVLPQMLASLGAVFAAAGIGTTIGALAGSIIPSGSVFLAVLLYGLGMVVFTMIMGNAFAAFPVMSAAIGIPILIHQDGGNPAVIGAVGMLSGFCGTLMTPMAANFNIVPAALLELKNQYAVIKAQIPHCNPAADCQYPHPLFRGVSMNLDAAECIADGENRAWACHQGISAQARSCARKRCRHALAAACITPDLLRQLRLA